MGTFKNTIITVTVDVSKLNSGCDGATSFSDNRGNTGESGNDIDSEVNPGKKIIWVGDLANSEEEDDFIDLLAVVKKDPGQPRLLKSDYYFGRDGIIEGKIKKSTSNTVQELPAGKPVYEEYAISFLVKYGEELKLCTIDPKIRMTK